MASTYSPSLKIQLMSTGENAGTWGDITNTNLGTALEEAIVGSSDVTFVGADITLSLADTNTTQVARALKLNLVGTSGGARVLYIPGAKKNYIIDNALADPVTISVVASPGTSVTIPAGKSQLIYCDSFNVESVISHLDSLSLTNALPVTSGGTGASTALGARTNLSVPANDGTGATGTWNINVSGSAASATTATTATNIAAGAANQITYQTGAGVTSFIAAPSTASTFLQWNGSAFTWAPAGGGGGGVTSITGTSNQVIASASTGAVTLSLPQSIATSSNVTFSTVTATSTMYSNGNVIAYYSDDRLKTRLDNITSAVEKLLTLDTFYYEANETAQALGYEPKREVGISAQQVQAILPEAVHPAPVDPQYLTVQYERLVPLIIQAIKELAGMIPGGSSANPGVNRTEV